MEFNALTGVRAFFMASSVQGFLEFLGCVLPGGVCVAEVHSNAGPEKLSIIIIPIATVGDAGMYIQCEAIQCRSIGFVSC